MCSRGRLPTAGRRSISPATSVHAAIRATRSRYVRPNDNFQIRDRYVIRPSPDRE